MAEKEKNLKSLKQVTENSASKGGTGAFSFHCLYLELTFTLYFFIADVKYLAQFATCPLSTFFYSKNLVFAHYATHPLSTFVSLQNFGFRQSFALTKG